MGEEVIIVTNVLTELGKVFTQLIAWVGEVVMALLSTDGALNPLVPLYLLGIAISVALVVWRLIHKATWGN